MTTAPEPWDGNPWSLPETRILVADYLRDFPETVYLGRINPKVAGHGALAIVWRHRGEFVHNFSADFVLPAYDATLVELIIARDFAPYTGTSADRPRVEAILARVREVGGALLTWS